MQSRSPCARPGESWLPPPSPRSEEHTSELQSLRHLVCRLLLEKKNNEAPDTQQNDSSLVEVKHDQCNAKEPAPRILIMQENLHTFSNKDQPNTKCSCLRYNVIN